MSDQSPTVLRAFDTDTGVATLTFNRPAVFNALNIAMAEAFEEATAWLKGLDGLRCVVLAGAGKAFMAGGDVADFAADPDAADRVISVILNSMHPALLALRRLDAPVVAAVRGSAAGAGFSLVLAADYVIAQEGTKLILAYDKLGVTPDCSGSYYLARKIGRGRAFDLMLTGKLLTTEDAETLGIVNRVASAEEFDRVVAGTTARIASGPTLAFGRFKQIMDAEVPLAAHLELERQAFVAATATQDFRNAARAFVEKQKPSFEGR